MDKPRRAKASVEEMDAMIRRIQESAPPQEWPTYGMSDDQVIEHCRKVRDELWEEKLARHASRS